MKKFKFQFESLARIRSFAEKEAKEALGREVSALNEIEYRIAENDTKRVEAGKERFVNTVSAYNLENYTYYIMRLQSENEMLRQEAILRQKKVDAAREVYIEASREKKIVDKLKEKHFKEYKKEKAKFEETELDERKRNNKN